MDKNKNAFLKVIKNSETETNSENVRTLETKVVESLKDSPIPISFEEYAENLDWLSTYFDESYWNGGLNTETCFESILSYAEKDGFYIYDKDTTDYETFLYALYQNTEKGLS